MRVLLIHPPCPLSETPSPPLGLAYLAASLRGAGATVRILDFVVVPRTQRRLAETLSDFAPDAVGVTAVTMNVDPALEIVRWVKKMDAGVRTVMGGPHVSFRAEETLMENPTLDAVVVGEGEATFVELLEAWDDGRALDGVAGIVVRQGRGARRTPRRERIADLDSLPDPARDLLSLGRYRALGLPVSMTTSRGCPHRCIFCVGRKMVGGRVRYRSARRVVDEMEALAACGFRQVNVADDLFTANDRHCRNICDEILRRGLDVRWTAFARVDSVSEQKLRRMRQAGCTTVSFGVESGSEALLRTARKGIHRAQVLAAVEMCRRAGVEPHASFLLGLPGETPDTLDETLAFGRTLQDRGVAYGFHLLAPFPGTEVRERAGALGLRILTDDWSRYDANRAVVETDTVPARMLDRIVRRWEERFLEWLGRVDAARRAGTSAAADREQLENLERTVVLYALMMNEFFENRAAAPGAAPPSDPALELPALAEEAAAALGKPAAEVAAALQTAYERGDLVGGNGGRTWKWRETLP